MAKQLYVDRITPSGTIAVATNIETVNYNLRVLDRFNDTSSPIFLCGRFVCMVMTKEPGETNMFFLDIHGYPKAEGIIFKREDFPEGYKRKFFELLELYHSTYEERKNDIELVKGFPPEIEE